MSSNDESLELFTFAEWISSIGDGKIGIEKDGATRIEILNHMLIENDEDLIDSIARVIYHDLEEIIDDPSYLQDIAILAPTLDVADAVNQHMIEKMSGECRTYYGSNTACKLDLSSDILANVHTPEFLNSIKYSGVPNHELNLKVGTPVILLKNVDLSLRLFNGTRLILTRLRSRVLEGKIITGNSADEKVLVPGLFLTPSDFGFRSNSKDDNLHP